MSTPTNTHNQNSLKQQYPDAHLVSHFAAKSGTTEGQVPHVRTTHADEFHGLCKEQGAHSKILRSP